MEITSRAKQNVKKLVAKVIKVKKKIHIIIHILGATSILLTPIPVIYRSYYDPNQNQNQTKELDYECSEEEIDEETALQRFRNLFSSHFK